MICFVAPLTREVIRCIIDPVFILTRSTAIIAIAIIVVVVVVIFVADAALVVVVVVVVVIVSVVVADYTVTVFVLITRMTVEVWNATSDQTHIRIMESFLTLSQYGVALLASSHITT